MVEHRYKNNIFALLRETGGIASWEEYNCQDEEQIETIVSKLVCFLKRCSDREKVCFLSSFAMLWTISFIKKENLTPEIMSKDFS